MIVPWPLLLSLAVSLGAGALWVVRQGGRVGEVLDVVLSVALPAVVTARLVSLGVDAVLIGGWPPLPAMLSLGSGLPAGAAVIGGVVAGWRVVATRTSPDTESAKATEGSGLIGLSVQAGSLGLVVWGLASVIRGDVAGVVAPIPLGVPLPGLDDPRVPVGILEALASAAVFWAVGWGPAAAWRAGRQAALLAAAVAATVVGGGLLRPAVATVDADVAAVLGLVALVLTLPLALGRVGPVTKVVLPIGVLSGLGIIVAALLAAPATLPIDRDALRPSLAGAIAAGVPDGEPPVWDAEDVAALVADADGPVVINFWASWCPPCHAEAPAVARAADAIGDATFLGVLVDDSPRGGQTFADRYGLGFPTVIDGGVSAVLGSGGLPTTVVLDETGEVAHREVGGLDAASLAAAVDRARR
ncbi:TlpA family protein disulfide reductase [Euzebya tangerina]|uniref:TlpA family protein disulfide reductase n=1 Tax=Euzebya tangerina TaxID=591198 RepID=UPI000E31FEE6|nr:TlpA disulfide reductase family protein [Euzebya tangerina]